MAQVTITGSTDVNDCFILDNDPTLKGTTGLYSGERNDQASVRRSILEFDLSAIPLGSTINSATLRLYEFAELADNTRDHKVYRIKRNTNGALSTWNKYDGSTAWQTAGGTGANDYDSTSIGTKSLAGDEGAGWKEWSLTASAIEEQISGGIFPNAGKGTYMVKADTESDDAHRFENTANYQSTGNLPELVINYTPPRGNPMFFQGGGVAIG